MSQEINFKILLSTFKALHNLSPAYLLQAYAPCSLHQQVCGCYQPSTLAQWVLGPSLMLHPNFGSSLENSLLILMLQLHPTFTTILFAAVLVTLLFIACLNVNCTDVLSLLLFCLLYVLLLTVLMFYYWNIVACCMILLLIFHNIR